MNNKEIRELIERLEGAAMFEHDIFTEAARTLSLLLDHFDASLKLKADMLMRADIGTFDGDHSVQAGATVWWRFCETLKAVEDA